MVVLLGAYLSTEDGEEYFDVDYDFESLLEWAKSDYEKCPKGDKEKISSMTVTQYRINLLEGRRDKSCVNLYWALYSGDISCPQFDLNTKWFTDDAIVKQVRIV